MTAQISKHLSNLLSDFNINKPKTALINGIPSDATDYETLGGMTSYYKCNADGNFLWTFGWQRLHPDHNLEFLTPIDQKEAKRVLAPRKQTSKPVYPEIGPTPIYSKSKYKGD